MLTDPRRKLRKALILDMTGVGVSPCFLRRCWCHELLCRVDLLQ